MQISVPHISENKLTFPYVGQFKKHIDPNMSLNDQLQRIDELAKEEGITDVFQIEWQKHVLIVAATLEAMSKVTSDDMRIYLEKPSKLLHQSINNLANVNPEEINTMAYSNETSIADFAAKYKLKVETTTSIFKNTVLPSFDVSNRLKEDIKEAKSLPLYTEKAKSELIISPILKELKRKNQHISIFSGFSLNIKGHPKLSGTPDFMLSADPNIIEVTAPIFCLFESKNKSPDEGFAQCAAEMYAARIFNKQKNNPHKMIYGAVSNAFEWVFMKLEADTIFVDIERYYLLELPKVLGIMQYIVNQYK